MIVKNRRGVMDPPCGIFPPSIIPPRFVFLGCSIDNVKTTTTTQSLKKMFEESRKFSLKLNNKTNNILDCKRGGRGCVLYVPRRDERVFYMLMEHHALFLFTVLKPPAKNFKIHWHLRHKVYSIPQIRYTGYTVSVGVSSGICMDTFGYRCVCVGSGVTHFHRSVHVCFYVFTHAP